MLDALKAANLALAFLLELCILAALGYWGFTTGNTTLAKVLLGIGAPVLAAVVWGIFLAPKAAVQLAEPLVLVLKIIVFSLAILALAAAGRPTLAWIFAVLVALNLILMSIWRQ